MNDSESGISSYESQVKRGYSEFGHEGLGVEHWGTMIASNGERFNAYTDKRFIRICFIDPVLEYVEGKKEQVVIADLGGDDGFLLNEILTQLREEKPDLKVKGVVTDIDSTGKARKKFEEKQKEMERKDIEYVVADITKLPLVDQSIDIVVSRMAMQYLDETAQEQFIMEASRVLKEEGLFLLQTITSQSNINDFNEILSEVTTLISKSNSFKRVFPAFEKFGTGPRSSKEYNFETLIVSRRNLFPISVRAFADRFKIDVSDLERVYKNKSIQFPDQFELIDEQLCLMGRVLNTHLKKLPMSHR